MWLRFALRRLYGVVPMINKIKIRSFKSLDEQEVDLGLVNVFIGANGSGKSNFLEAVGVLSAAVAGKVDDLALLRSGVRPGLPALYKTSFKNVPQPNEIRFTAETELASYSVSLNNPLRNPQPAWRYKSELLVENGKKIVGRSPNLKIKLDPSLGYTALKAIEFLEGSPAEDLFDRLRDYAIFTPDTPTLRALKADNYPREPVGLNGGNLSAAVKDLFTDPESRELFDEVIELIGWAAGIGTSHSSAVQQSKSVSLVGQILRFKDRYMDDKRNWLSGYEASEGALYVLLMTVLTHHLGAPRLLAVDNFDHALNPRLAKALTRKICQWSIANNDRQLLLTSHNPLVLDGLPLKDDRVRLFTVERSGRGKTIITRVEVSDRLLEEAEKGVPLSQQWVTGTFGGMPRGI